jgi:hypothetical protein
MKNTSLDTAAGAAIYSRPVLSVYDFFVLGFSNMFVWRCPSRLILAFYNEHISDNHLDVGVGTGFFLDRCQFPVPHPRLTLVDLNPNSLQVTAQRLQRYQPETYIADVLEPLPFKAAQFDSLALNYVLHCLPGTLRSKGVVFGSLKPWLNKDGVIFGTTILGAGVKKNFLAKRLMRAYNSKKIFGNTYDHAADLEKGLQENFRDYTLHVVGCVAFFVGRV